MPRLVAQVACLSEVERLACHAFDFKWHTHVPRHAVQVARPWICEVFKLGVPRLGSQVARPSDFLELACHAFNTKWHAIGGGSSWNGGLACHAPLLKWHAHSS
ncbi:hypothetical protein AHAS_Ahas12G0093900 [Arachis hypogaea]